MRKISNTLWESKTNLFPTSHGYWGINGMRIVKMRLLRIYSAKAFLYVGMI